MLHFYDPLAPELLLRSARPYVLSSALWNPFNTSELEFVVEAESKFEFWRLTPELHLDYQEGKLIGESGNLRCLVFSEPFLALTTVLLGIGKSNGSLVLVDTRTNSPVAIAQLSSKPIQLLQWRQHRLIYGTTENSVCSAMIDTYEYI